MQESYEYRGRVYTCWTKLEAALVAEILFEIANSGHPRAIIIARLAAKLRKKSNSVVDGHRGLA